MFIICVMVISKEEERKWIKLVCICINDSGMVVIVGEVEVIVFIERIECLCIMLLDVCIIIGSDGIYWLFDYVWFLGVICMVVVYLCDVLSLFVVMDVYVEGLIVLCFVVLYVKLMCVVVEVGFDFKGIEIEDVLYSSVVVICVVEFVI